MALDQQIYLFVCECDISVAYDDKRIYCSYQDMSCFFLSIKVSYSVSTNGDCRINIIIIILLLLLLLNNQILKK